MRNLGIDAAWHYDANVKDAKALFSSALACLFFVFNFGSGFVGVGRENRCERK